ncbi:MAG TPA: phospholipase D-like domain-containing protein [Burkholderiaceae bacterium]|nr:phospholipase D-like domain-containing protein [Burkholderiaceae bacterium]
MHLSNASLWPAMAPRHAHAHELVRRLGEPMLRGNRVELLQDGPQTFEAMFRAIAAARDHVNIESYIVAADGPGEELAARLVQRCRSGVKVNLLFDSFGSLRTSSAFFTRLAQAGVSLCEYNPVQRWGALVSRALHLRDHRKLLVVDGSIGFIGGVNISPVYGSGPAAGSGSAGWRDLHVQVAGPAVHRLQELFVAHWKRFATHPMQPGRYFPPLAPAGTQSVGVAACDAGRCRNPYYSALLGAIDTARSSVRLTTAYLVPPRRLLRSLVHAAERGVAVELLLPGISDFWAPLQAGRSHYTRLLQAGVQIHERHDRLLHAKACVIDGVWASVGSSNADWRSIVHNAEANLLVLDEAFAAQVEQVFRQDVARARRIDADRWAERPCWHRCTEALARRFEFFL